MSPAKVWQVMALIVIVFSLAGCRPSRDCMTVSEVGQNAESLAGQQICVRGQPDFRFVPYHPMMRGGCIPGDSPSIGGELELVDEGSSDPVFTLSISDLQCEGHQCAVECRPFSPGCTKRHDELFCEDIEAFEFVGTLRVDGQPDNKELILEDLDLSASRRSVDGEWGPIPTGEFQYGFP
jgi:hypothetical protein